MSAEGASPPWATGRMGSLNPGLPRPWAGLAVLPMACRHRNRTMTQLITPGGLRQPDGQRADKLLGRRR